MEGTREAAKQMRSDAESIKETLERMERSRAQRQTTDVRIEGGGVGVWVAVTCCLIMLAVVIVGSVFGGLWLSREFARVDKELNERKEEGQRMQSYLSAIYVNAPHLKPKEGAENVPDR